MTYALAPHISIRESAQGIFLVAPRPLRMVRLNGALLVLVRQIEEGPLAPETEGSARVLEELAKRGFLQRLQGTGGTPAKLPRVSIVIPVMDREEELRECLTSLCRIDYPEDLLEVIVVDDGSSDGSAEVASAFGATVLSSGGRGRGPAAARNRGAEAATGEILAFIDSDCTASIPWLKELVGAFADPQVAAVGGLVDGMYRTSALDRYEAVMSSLSLGKHERSGQGGDDTFYLPSCNLLVRRDAFARVGGFRVAMHVGEDVDLTWRLRDGGFRIIYRPQGRVLHAHRSYLPAFLKRRFEYGTSEGLLQTLHPERRKKMAFPPLLCAVLACCAAGIVGGGLVLFLAAAVLLAGDAVVTRSESRRLGFSLEFHRIAASRFRTFVSLCYYVSFHLTRYYGWPLFAIAMLWPSGWPLLLPVVLWPALVDWYVRRPDLSPPVFFFFYLLEHLAYGAGVFRGCLGQRSFASYRLQSQRRMPLVF
jgi:mycofactocin glycosyltransferase